MPKRIFKIGIRVAIAFAILLVVFVVVSLLVIDRGQPTVIGTLSPQELKTIRRAVRRSAVEIPRSEDRSGVWHPIVGSKDHSDVLCPTVLLVDHLQRVEFRRWQLPRFRDCNYISMGNV